MPCRKALKKRIDSDSASGKPSARPTRDRPQDYHLRSEELRRAAVDRRRGDHRRGGCGLRGGRRPVHSPRKLSDDRCGGASRVTRSWPWAARGSRSNVPDARSGAAWHVVTNPDRREAWEMRSRCEAPRVPRAGLAQESWRLQHVRRTAGTHLPGVDRGRRSTVWVAKRRVDRIRTPVWALHGGWDRPRRRLSRRVHSRVGAESLPSLSGVRFDRLRRTVAAT